MRQPVDGAGRTDAGVHAAGQVIAFTYAGPPVDAEALEAALNGLLPPDVAVRDVRRARRGFHPRSRGAVPGVPLHRLERAAQPAPRAQALGVRDPLDVAAMARAGQAFVGRHDFSAFGGAGIRSRSGPCMRSGSGRQGSLVTIDVAGRRLPARAWSGGSWPSSSRSAREDWTTTEVRAALAARTPARNGAAAPARGLCLRRVVLGRRHGARNEQTETTRGTMSTKTYTVRESEIERRWYVVDAADETLGRLAVAHRARARGQAQADVRRRTSIRATT